MRWDGGKARDMRTLAPANGVTIVPRPGGDAGKLVFTYQFTVPITASWRMRTRFPEIAAQRLIESKYIRYSVRSNQPPFSQLEVFARTLQDVKSKSKELNFIHKFPVPVIAS